MTRFFSARPVSDARGSVLTVAAGVVLVVGVLSFSTYSLLSGPIRSASVISLKTKAQSDIQIAARLLMNATVDSDADGVREPVAPNTAPSSKPTGGGIVPVAVGAAQRDPWGQPYGYCAWNHGSDNAAGGGVLAGTSAAWDAAVFIAVISAGPDRVFQTTCADHPGYVTPGGDDVVETFVYKIAETAASGGGGLWAQAGTDISYATDSVLVGNVAAPTAARFQVAADAEIGGDLAVLATHLATFEDALSVTGTLTSPAISTTGTLSVAGALTMDSLSGLTVGSPIVENLNADLLDGQHGAYYLDWANKTGDFPPQVIPTITGDVSYTPGTNIWRILRVGGRAISATVPSTGHMLVWNDGDSVWEPRHLVVGDDVTSSAGVAAATTVVKIQDRPVNSTAPSANQVLGWNGAAWAPMGIGPTGSPTVVEYEGVNFLALDSNITSGSCASGTLPKYNGTTWACTADATGVGSLPLDLDLLNNTVENPYRWVMSHDVGAQAFWGLYGEGNTYFGHNAAADIEAITPEPSGASEAHNTIIGHEAMEEIDASAHESVVLGMATAQFAAPAQSVIMGTFAGRRGTTGFARNVILGTSAGEPTNPNRSSYADSVILGRNSGTIRNGDGGVTLVGNNILTSTQVDSEHLTFIGHSAARELGTGSYNTGIGTETMRRHQTGTKNTTLGYAAGYHSGGTASYSNNVLVGSYAGRSLTSGSDNIFVGYESGYSYTTQGQNIALGWRAARNATSGEYNIHIGRSSGFNAGGSSGDYNIMIGYETGYQGASTSNIFIGASAGHKTSGSQFNTVLGYNAGLNITNASFNTLIGAWAGEGNTTFGGAGTQGYENLFVGADAAYNITTGSINTIVGTNTAETLASGQGNVIIGHGLDVAAAGTNDYFAIGSDRASVGAVLYGDLASGNLTLKGTLTAPSDIRLKRDFRPIEGALDKIKKINGVVYKWRKNHNPDTRDRLGVIAQDVQKVVPEAVFKMGDNPKAKYYTVSYEHLVPLLIEGVKEQEDKLVHLERQLDTLMEKRRSREEAE